MANRKDTSLLGGTPELQHEGLFSLVKNAISYGEWELARASAKLYHQTAPSSKENLQILLLDVIKHPRKYSYGSTTIPTPFHLSWLALLLFLELFPQQETKEQLVTTTKYLIEFKLHLFALSKDLLPEQEQDSYCFFKLGFEQNGHHENMIGLSKEYRSFISDFAIKNPLSCRTLTNFLVYPLPGIAMVQRKSMVGECYLRILLSYIGRMKLFEESVQTMFLAECFPVIISAKQYFSSDSALFTNAISSVVEIILEHNPSAIKLLYCSLIDNDSIPFLMVALELSWKFKLSTLKLQDILEETKYGEDEQNIHVAELLSESFKGDSSQSMMTSFQICDYYNVNFLDCILNASLELVSKRNYQKTLELLATGPMQTLRPLVVLLAWSQCSSFREKSDLISSLLTMSEVQYEPAFDYACKRLEYNLKVGIHCLQKERTAAVPDESDVGIHRGEETDIFQEMDFHSILYVLNKLHFLTFLHAKEVVDILSGQPSCFLLESSMKCEKLKQSEIRTYLRFSVLEIVLHVFFGKVGNSSFINNMRTFLRDIQPLSYRLETLEDMFSLLFVRKEHYSAPEMCHDTNHTTGIIDHPSRIVDKSVVTDSSKQRESSKFLFQQDLVKKYLDLLNEFIAELIADKYSDKEKDLQGSDNPEISILSSDFDRRISQLQQNLNHAIWRFELVSGFNSDDNSAENSVEDAHSVEKEPIDASRPNFKVRISEGKSEHLLSQMLSSPESLAHLCLQKGSMLQAQQVIKVFQLEEYYCGLEADFAEVLSRSIESLKATQPIEVTSKSTQLTNIKSAAAAGLMSSSVRSSVNGLLKHKCLHLDNSIPKSPLEDMSCFASVAVCFDLVASAELHSAVCKTILDMSEELIKSADDSHSELKSLLMGHLTALKSSILVYSQTSTNQIRVEMNDYTKSFSHFFTKSYRKPRGEDTELALQILAQQKIALQDIVSYIDEGMNEDGVLREDKTPETNACRKSMNDTLAAFSSDSLVLIPQEKTRRNYIKTLFRHMDTLARLQLYFRTKHNGVQGSSKLEQKSSLSGVQACNPFVVLKDDITVIFGRLLFEWNMPPKRLESIAKQVNISLVKVIARKFELSIPVKSRKCYPDLATFLLTRPREILNSRTVLAKEHGYGESPHPVKVIEDLIVLLLSIIKALPPTYETHVGSTQFKELVASEEFIDFQQKTNLLKHVDLHNLEDDEAKICFMSNLYNVMFIHGILIILSGSLDGTPNLSVQEHPKWTYEGLMESAIGRFAIDKFLSYEVGQLGVLSAFDLLRHILLGSISSSYYGDAFKTRNDLFEWTPDRLAYAPRKHEKRCIFVLTHGSASCPTFKLLKQECFNTQLQLAQKGYLEQNITVAQNELKITVPKLLYWHRDLFLERQPLYQSICSSSSLDCKDRNRLLLEFIKKSSKKLCDQLDNMTMENASIRVTDFNWKLSFNVAASKPVEKSQKYVKRSVDVKREENYSFNEPIKKYMYDTSPVPAALICMMLEKKKFLHQISEMIVESKYGGIRMGDHRISSLQKFIEDGIKSLSQAVESSPPLKAFTALCCEVVYKILQSLQVDQPNASNKYVENVQSLIKVTVSMLDVCGSINVESSRFLKELLNIFVCHGGILIAAFFETFPHICPVQSRDHLLCESICGIREWLDDLIDTCVAVGENALKIDLDRIHYLTVELKRCLMLLNEPYLRCRMTLDSVTFFDVDEALEILEVCAEDCSASEESVIKLNSEARKIKWYDDLQKIFVSRFHEKQPPKRVKLTRWQDCKDFVQYHPEDVTILLIADGSSEQIDFWINNFYIPHHLSKVCLRAKLHDILKDDCLQYSDLYTVLENLPNKHIAFQLCEDFLQDTELPTNYLLLILRYMIENLVDVLSEDQILQLRCTELAFKALDQFPNSLKASYWHLTSKPELIVEQLVMNMKIELAKKVVDIFRECIVYDSPLSYLLVKIDEVLAFYGEKSLDVPVIETSLRKDSRLGSIDRRKLASKHVRNSSYQNTSIGINSEITKPEKSSNATSTADEKLGGEISLKPVDAARWVSDESESTCQICKVQVFSIFNRRHHCRHCGRLSCASCSTYRCAVRGNPGKVRVCRECFEKFYSTSSSSRRDEDEQATVTDPPPHIEASSSVPLSSTIGNSIDTEFDLGRKAEDGEYQGWQLTVDENDNREIRNHFCFDQAPSASLCVAIIEQCSDAQKIGGLLLKFCNKLSEYLNEKASAKYHDIDSTLLVRMIEFLNFNAKVKFMKAGFINGVELCDFEMAHVEILKILLNSDWKEIPTMQELSHPEVIRRLRDKIIDSERFSLAIDVTGKCGLDPNAVWFAWGLSQLKSGDLRVARENFSKCLTPLRSAEDKGFQQNAFYLNQIVEVIEASPLLAFSQGDLLSPLHALQGLDRVCIALHALQDLTNHRHGVDVYTNFINNKVDIFNIDFANFNAGSSTGCSLDTKRYDEIMYYLNKYGTHSQVIKFFVRQGLFKKAADYIKTQRCSPEVFFDDLLLRSFQIGSFDVLAREIELMDPSLNKWKDYLSKSCQYLSRKGLYNCLYHMQLFLKDYFRAATTCIRFFLGASGSAARSFKELYRRMYHLENAKKHLEMLLKEKAITKSTFVSHVGSQPTVDPFSAPLVRDVPVSDLKSHLNTVLLQMKVLNFFNGRPEVFEDRKRNVPTLFGDGRERSHLISFLLAESISDTFSLVSRIIQDYRLPAVSVFSDCVPRLIQKKGYDYVFSLMKTIEGTGIMPDKGRDHLLLKVIKNITSGGEGAKQASPFVKMMFNQSAKVEALILCGRLRDAYVEATKENQVENVERILKEAERLNQKYVVDICQRFLKNFEEKQERKGISR